MEAQIIDLLRRIKALEARLGITETTETETGGVAPAHNVLSATHSDATVSAVTRGDIIVGNATPAWDDLAIGVARQLLATNAGGTDPEWKSFDWDDMGGAVGADMVHDHSSAAEGGEVPVASLGGYTRGDIIRGGAADWEDYSAKSAGFILVGDGNDITSAAFDWDTMSGGVGADMVHDHSVAGEGGEVPLASLGGYTQGDVIYGGAVDWQDLAIGVARQLLTVNAGATAPEWKSFDWDDMGGAAGADMVHDHSSAAEGGTTIDVNGAADAIVLDADGDTSISAPVDDQIDIEINNADDFTFTANTFTALSGSSIATDTISETTGAAGVTVDGVLLKDTTVDVNGTADAIILDADGDTTISAPTDDQIDVEINSVDTYVLTGTALKSSGSVFPNIGSTTLAEKFGNIYLGTAKDVYPYDSEAGVDQRRRCYLSPTDDIDYADAVTNHGWDGWAAYVNFETPGTVSTTSLDSLLFAGNFSGANKKGFLYRTALGATPDQYIACALSNCPGNFAVGIRLDDGSDTNWVEFVYLMGSSTPQTASLVLRNSGGSTATGSTIVTQQVPILYMQVGGTKYTNWQAAGYLYGENGIFTSFLQGVITGLTWTPSRYGILIDQGSNAAASFHLAVVDFWKGS